MGFSWRDHHTPIILDLLKARPAMWDYHSAAYSDRILKNRAIREIIEELRVLGVGNVTEYELKAKIKTIRTRYSAELGKVKRSCEGGAGPDDVYVPKLFWFKQADSFLRAVTSRQSSKDISAKTSSDTQSSDVSTEEFDVNFVPQEYSLNTNPNPSAQMNILNSQSMSQNSSISDSSQSSESSQCKKPTLEKHPTFSVVSLNKVVEKLQEINRDMRPAEDEFDYFGKTIAAQLRNMPLDRAIVCQDRIQRMMNSERLLLFSKVDKECPTVSSEVVICNYEVEHSGVESTTSEVHEC